MRIERYVWRVVSLGLVALVFGCSSPTPAPAPALKPTPAPYVPHANAVWPWPKAAKSEIHEGVFHWLDESAEDGTTLDLIRFDFKANPHLRLELYDQDEDDAVPFDNRADYYARGVGTIVKHLHDKKRGKVVAAWNGLFFAYSTPGGGPGVLAHHIGPVVLGGKARYNVGNHRWTFGVKVEKGEPRFRAERLPKLSELPAWFDFAAAGAQMLVHEGKRLDPAVGGEIAVVDQMRTSRVSMAWSKDSRFLYLLYVNEPDTEIASKIQVRHGEQSLGGWALEDLRRFWVSFGAWGAVNSDGGAVAQLAYLRGDGNYELLPARVAAGNRRLVVKPDFEGAPAGGTLMTFYVVERR